MSDTPLKLIERAARARRENQLIDAHRDFAAAIALCRQTGTRDGLVRALNGLGQIERDLGQGEAARVLYEEAVDICRGETDALELAHTVRHLGDVHQEAGCLNLAEPCYLEALALYRQHEQTPPLDLANAIRAMAVLKERAGDVGEAAALWREAGDLYASVHVLEGINECSRRLVKLRR